MRHINQIKNTLMSLRTAFKCVYSEIDELRAEIYDLKTEIDELKKAGQRKTNSKTQEAK